jgi:Mg-chelatase subunit ChlD
MMKSYRRAGLTSALLLTFAVLSLGWLRGAPIDGRALAGSGVSQAKLKEAWRLAATWDGSQGQSAPGAVLYPAGIDIAGNTVYVVDQGNSRIERFGVDGTVSAVWGQPGHALGDLQDPQDVAVDGSQVYVTDRGNGRLVVYSLDGQAQQALTAPGLTAPWGVAAKAGRVYVTSPNTGEVVIFQDGAVVARWTGLQRPRGLSIGVDGRVYVADEGASAVKIFGADGSAQGSLSTNLAPLDVAVDERADLYVQSDRAVVWYQAGKTDSTQALYYTGLRGVAVSSRNGVFGTVARDAKDPRDRTFHGVVIWPWRPQNVTPVAEWSLLGYPPGRLNGPSAISTGADGTLWVLDGWPRAQAFAPDGHFVTQHAPTGLALAADVGVGPDGAAILGEARRMVRLKPDGTISNTVQLTRGVTHYWLTALALQDAGLRATMLDSAELAVRDYGITKTVNLVDSWGLGEPNRWRLYWDLAVPVPNPRERVYLVNRSDKAIEVFEARQKVGTWPTDGIPARIALDADGNVFVLTVDGLVSKYAADGTLVAAWDAAAYSVGRTEVLDLTVGPDGRVYTVDRAANNVRVWERDPSGTPEPPLAQSGACRIRADKRAAPDTLLLGGTATITLDVGGDCPNSAPQADILLAIDRSGSMNDSNKITDTRKAAQAFIDAIDLNRDRVGIVAFNNGGELMQPLTGDRAAAQAAVGRIKAYGGTNIASALDMATAELFGPRGRPDTQPVIILLTDGRDREPDNALRSAAAAKASGAHIFTIGFGEVDPMVMVLTASTPEEYFYAPDTSKLTDIYGTIARRITASVLARTMTLTDDLPNDMTYVASVTGPVPTVQGQRLTWQLTNVPFAGLSLSYTVRPTLIGHRPTNVQAVAEFVDGLDRAGRARFPVPFVDVLNQTPTPRPSNTPQPTITPRPTWTPTPTEPPEPIYLPITVMQRCEDRTVHADVALVMDTSGSMNEVTYAGGPTKLAAAVDAARLFIDQLALPDDRAAIVTFNSDVTLAQTLTGDKAALLAALAAIQTKSGTRIDLGIAKAQEELTGANGRAGQTRVIVLLTDGRPSGVEPQTVIDVAHVAQQANIIIYAIGLGTDLDVDLLKAVSSGTGFFFQAPTTDELQKIYRTIAYTIQCVNLTWPPGRPTPSQ